MKQCLIINVYLNNTSFEKKKALFTRELLLSDGVSVDYQRLVDSFRFLFGVSCVVDFNLSVYG